MIFTCLYAAIQIHHSMRPNHTDFQFRCCVIWHCSTFSPFSLLKHVLLTATLPFTPFLMSLQPTLDAPLLGKCVNHYTIEPFYFLKKSTVSSRQLVAGSFSDTEVIKLSSRQGPPSFNRSVRCISQFLPLLDFFPVSDTIYLL